MPDLAVDGLGEVDCLADKDGAEAVHGVLGGDRSYRTYRTYKYRRRDEGGDL
jgi:hypothetical protein